MMGERKRSSSHTFSIVRWGVWVAVVCAVILAFEVATGYYSLTGSASNRAFVAFTLIIVAVVAMARPEIPFLLAVFFMAPSEMVFPGIAFVSGHLANMELVHPLIAASLVGWVFKAVRKREPVFRGSALTFPLVVFFGWSTLSLSWAILPIVSKWAVLDVFFGLLIYFAAVKAIRSRQILERTVKTWVASGILLTGLGLKFVMTGAAARVQEMTENPNVFSLEMNFIIMLVIGLLYLGGTRHVRPGLLWVFLLLMLFVDLRTGSRAGFFSLMVGIFFFLFSYHWQQKDRKHLSLLFFCLVALAALVAVLFTLNPLEGFKIGFRSYNPAAFSSEGTFKFRLEIWGLAWDYIRESGRWLQGLGIYSFIIMTRDQYAPVNHPHSIYVFVFVHYGLVGVAIFAWIITVIVQQFHAGMKAAREMYYKVILRAMAAGLLIFAIHGIVDFGFEQRRSVWLFTGVAMAAARLAADDGARRKAEGDRREAAPQGEGAA